MSYGIGHRHGSDPALLWLWYRLVAAAPIEALSLGAFICHRCGPKSDQKKNIFQELHIIPHSICGYLATLRGRKQYFILRGRGPRLAEVKSLGQGLEANRGQIWDTNPGWVTTVLSCLPRTSCEAPEAQLMVEISNHLILCVVQNEL